MTLSCTELRVKGRASRHPSSVMEGSREKASVPPDGPLLSHIVPGLSRLVKSSESAINRLLPSLGTGGFVKCIDLGGGQAAIKYLHVVKTALQVDVCLVVVGSI